MTRLLLSLTLLASSALFAEPAWAKKGAGVGLPTLPATYEVPSDGPQTTEPWWLQFDDPSLDAVMAEGMAANLDIATAINRAQQASAAQLQAFAPLSPTASADGNIQFAPLDTLGFQFGGIPGGAGDEGGNLYYNASAQLKAGWEIDLFGKNIVAFQAAVDDAQAGRADAADVRNQMASLIASTWFDVVLQSARVSVLEEQLKTNEGVLELTELRFNRSETSAVDVFQQRQQLEQTRGLLPQARAARDVSEQRLAVLLGRAPGDLPYEIPAELPSLPVRPDLGTPSDLMEWRPGLVAEKQRLDAAWRRRLSAGRAFAPTFRTNFNAGWQWFDAGEFKEQFAWGFGITASLPIWDGGILLSRLRQAKATERAQAHTLAKKMLEATQEVESAVTNEDHQVDRLDALRAQEEAARLAFETSVSRYADGLIDYLSVLASLNSFQVAQLSLLQGERDLINYRLQLHQALGGDWLDAYDNSSVETAR